MGGAPNDRCRRTEDLIVVTSRTFLALAAKAGFLADPEAAWSVFANGDPRAERPADMTDAQREAVLRLCVDSAITAEEATDRIGPGTAVVDVVLETRRLFNRLPDRRDAFTDGEYRRALVILGLDDTP